MAVVLTAIICISCSKKSIINPSKKMEQIYYTQEGSRYILKTVSLTNAFTEAAARNTAFGVCVYTDTAPTLDRYSIGVKSVKKIIPVSASLSAISTVSGNVIVDIESTYYTTVRGINGLVGAIPSFDNMKPLSKMSPLVDNVFYTNTNFYGYKIKYGQVVLSDVDFMSPQGGLSFMFTSNLAFAYTNSYLLMSNISIPADSYSIAIVFTYFELQ